MDLRDYFAGLVMQALVSQSPPAKAYRELSKEAYAIADAMIAERYEGGKPKYTSPAIAVQATMVPVAGHCSADEQIKTHMTGDPTKVQA